MEIKMILKVADYKEPNDIIELLKNGKKSIDTRPYNPNGRNDFSKLKSGDEIIFKHVKTGEELLKSAKRVVIYQDLDEMIENEDISKIIPNAKTKEDLLKVYKKFRGFVQEMEQNGIVAIELNDVGFPPARE